MEGQLSLLRLAIAASPAAHDGARHKETQRCPAANHPATSILSPLLPVDNLTSQNTTRIRLPSLCDWAIIQGSSMGEDSAIAILDIVGHRVRCPWGCLLCQHATMPGRPAAWCMPRHVAVVPDCESLHGRDEVSKWRTTSSSGPRVRPRVSWPDREGCPYGDKYVRLEMRVHLRISQWNMDGETLCSF